MADVFIYSEDGILWGYGHLDPDGLPEKLKAITRFNPESEVRVEEGEIIGKIGKWPEMLSRRESNKEHLHLATFYHLDHSRPYQEPPIL